MTNSLRNRIVDYLKEKYPRAIHSGEIERFTMELGYKASNGGRRCREMVNEKIIERSENEKGEVMYKWINEEKTKNPIPTQETRVENLFVVDSDEGFKGRDMPLHNVRKDSPDSGDGRGTRNWGQAQLFTV